MMERSESALLTASDAQRRHADLFERMAPGVVYQDHAGRIVLSNPAAERILGLSAAQLRGRESDDPRWQAIREDGSPFPGAENPATVALRTGQPVQNVVMGVFNPREGQLRWIRINAVPQFQAAGAAPTEVFTTFEDITELKQLEQALRRSEERFRIAAECSSDVLYEWDLQADEIEYFGRNRTGLQEGSRTPTRHWTERFHPDERDAILDELHLRIADGAFLSREHRVLADDGRWHHIVTRGQVVRDADGTPVRWIGASSDVTDHREAVERLKQTVNLLEAVAEGTTDPVFVKSVDGRYLMANSACAERFGIPVSDVLGKTNFDLTTAEIAEPLRAHDDDVVTKGKAVTFEAVGPGIPAPRQYLITKAPYRDTSGAIIGIVGIARDLTDFKRLEAEYRQAQKLEAVGRLAGGVAHDFNNLLTVILGYLDDLEGTTAVSHDALIEVRAAAERATQLTSQLLAFSRRQVLNPEPTDLTGLVRNLERMLLRVLGEDVRLHSVLAADLGTVRVDRGQFEQVVMNLVVNARDAMPKGGQLTLATMNYDVPGGLDGASANLSPGPYVMVTVTDTGTGIPKDVLPRIFEPFFTTKDRSGTGLGLATVYGIVKQSGGDVWVQSQPGEGTTFKILLPRIDAAPSNTAAPSPQPAVKGKGTILLVEDEDRLRALIRTVLERQGYTVWTCEDVPEATHWLTANADTSLDLVLTDMVMPNGTGLDLERRLRELRPDVKVLFMSGYSEPLAGSVGELPQGVQFIQKPFSPKDLALKVYQVVTS